MKRKEIAMTQEIKAALDYVRGRTNFVPQAALTLGSGLGSYAEEMEIVTEISYKDIPGFPVSTVPGHDGKFICGYVHGTAVICMKGRVHLYEGYSAQQVVMPIRLMQAMGARYLILTNAAGAMRSGLEVGSFALLTDHISLFVPNPLIGPNDEEEGVRYPDMTVVYDPMLRKLAHQSAIQNGIELKEGVYCQLTGPSFETPTEIRMISRLGADLVGMSTVIEAITARHMGMRVLGISLVSNLAAGYSQKPLTAQEVQETGEKVEPDFKKLVTGTLENMHKFLLS